MQCPYCRETIQNRAIVCRFCNAYRSGDNWERSTPGRSPHVATASALPDAVVPNPGQSAPIRPTTPSAPAAGPMSTGMPGDPRPPVLGAKPGSTVQTAVTWIALALIVTFVGAIALVALFGKSAPRSSVATTPAPAVVRSTTTPPTTSARASLRAWVAATDQAALSNAMDADLRDVQAALAANAMGYMATACSRLGASVAAVKGTLPAPDGTLNRDLVSMTEHYGKAAVICVRAASSPDGSGLVDFATELTLGLSAEANATSRLKVLNADG